MTFGQFIKVFMTDAGMNQKQLAEKIGISTPVMCDILTKKRGFRTCTNCILVFPTAEMRDAFYENFKSEIESCKELL